MISSKIHGTIHRPTARKLVSRSVTPTCHTMPPSKSRPARKNTETMRWEMRMPLLRCWEAHYMTIPTVILFADVPAAQLPVGGIPLATRHVKELYKHGVREFYLCGVTEIPLAL